MGSPRLIRPAGSTACGPTARSATVILATAAGFFAAACGAAPDALTLAATTSTHDSGLLDSLVVAFRRDHPELSLRTVVAGSGQALELARRGDVDLVIAHAPAAESAFIAAGHASGRVRVFENDFIVVGPPDDPAGVRGAGDAAAAMIRIATREASFVSRGDSSGTHERELRLWREAGLDPSRSRYIESGQGQGQTLLLASERQAYALADRATFRVLGPVLDLAALFEGDPALRNEYSVIVPRTSSRPEAAARFRAWLLSDAGRRAILDFRLPGDAAPLFRPAGPEAGAPSRDGPLEEAAPEDTASSRLTAPSRAERPAAASHNVPLSASEA